MASKYLDTYKKRKKKKNKEKTAYEKRMDARKKGETNTKKMAKREKTLRALKRFDPSLKGTDRGGYPKQYTEKGRKKASESPISKKYKKELKKYKRLQRKRNVKSMP